MSETSFGGFTERAKIALIAAEQAAQRLGSRALEPEHLLFGIISDPGGISAKVLREQGVTSEMVREAIKATVRPGDPTTDVVPLSEQTKEVIKLAVYETRNMRQRCVDASHLLLGILNLERGDVLDILKSLKVPLWLVRGQTRFWARFSLLRRVRRF